MKKTIRVLAVASILFGMWTSASGQNTTEEHGKLIEKVVSQIKSVLNPDTVLGAPRDFQGTKIVPIVSILFGFGSGSGTSAVVDEEQRSGAGGGGGIAPTGLLVITPDGEVRVIAAKKSALSEIIKEALPAVIESMKKQKQEED